MVIIVAKDVLDRHQGLKKQLELHAKTAQLIQQHYDFEPQPGKLYTFITLLNYHKVPYAVQAEK